MRKKTLCLLATKSNPEFQCWLTTQQTRNLFSVLLRKGKQKSALYSKCCKSQGMLQTNRFFSLASLILLFRWQEWHSTYKPKQQFLLFKVVGRCNNKIRIWQRNNAKPFYAQNYPYSWCMHYCHLTITHYLTDHHLVWMNKNFFLWTRFFCISVLYR